MRTRKSWSVPIGDLSSRTDRSVAPTRPVLPISSSCVPTVGRNRECFLVPAHYREAPDGPDEASICAVTALDREGREVRLPAYETEVTAEALLLLEGEYPDAPRHEYCPVRILEEAWAAYERLVPEEWMPTKSSAEVFAVRGPMPRCIVATIPVLGGEATVPLAPRVATLSGLGRREPMFRLALRNVVRVQTLDNFLKERGDGDHTEEALS